MGGRTLSVTVTEASLPHPRMFAQSSASHVDTIEPVSDQIGVGARQDRIKIGERRGGGGTPNPPMSNARGAYRKVARM
jgi:hypothetical protein